MKVEHEYTRGGAWAYLAALVPNPRVNPTRFHGVFAPNSPLRQQATPARRGKRPL